MPYPFSSNVAAGQQTQASQYNNLRKDALFLGAEPANSASLGAFLGSIAFNVRIHYLATNRLRIPYDSQNPASIVINGNMLVQQANIDLPAGEFSGAAAVWYIFANRSDAFTFFSLSVNTSPVPAPTQRLIGEVFWNGTNLAPSSIRSYVSGSDWRAPAYDSGWYAVAHNQTYVKAHGLGQLPREVAVYWSSTADESQTIGLAFAFLQDSGPCSPAYWDKVNIYTKTGTNSSYGVQHCMQAKSGTGYYRILAWV